MFHYLIFSRLVVVIWGFSQLCFGILVKRSQLFDWVLDIGVPNSLWSASKQKRLMAKKNAFIKSSLFLERNCNECHVCTKRRFFIFQFFRERNCNEHYVCMKCRFFILRFFMKKIAMNYMHKMQITQREKIYRLYLHITSNKI